MTEDIKAQINAQIGSLRSFQTLVSVIGRQFIRRHTEELGEKAPEAIAQANALINLINNDLGVEINNLSAQLVSADRDD